MFSFETLLTVPLLLAQALAAPTSPASPLQKRAQQCGQYQSQTSGPYTLSTNGWGWQYASAGGSQCSQIDGLTGNSLSWDTTYTWAGGPTNVKSYTNVQSGFTKKQLSQYTSIPTSWKWSLTGTNLASNVAYDTFVGTSAGGANTFEVMVWIGLYGGVSPLSANGYPFTPIATPNIGGVAFDLAYGTNGAMKVYSFVAHSHAETSYSGDLLNFYKYLIANYASNGFNGNLYLQNIQAGPEIFTGTNAKLTTSAYSISVN